MQFVTRAGTAISTGATQVIASVATASSTLQTELGAGISEATAAISTVTQQVSAVATQITQLSPPLNPQALVGPLSLALTRLQSDLGGVVNSLAGLGPRLATAGRSVDPVALPARLTVGARRHSSSPFAAGLFSPRTRPQGPGCAPATRPRGGTPPAQVAAQRRAHAARDGPPPRSGDSAPP